MQSILKQVETQKISRKNNSIFLFCDSKVEKEKILDDYPELKKHRKKFESTIKPFIEIKTKLDDKILLWQSKFGGLPYWPNNLEYPKDNKGEPLYLVAQINFEEIPAIELFPNKGILQWFISPESGLYGLDDYKYEDMINQKDWRVVYFPKFNTKDKILEDFSFLKDPKDYDPWPPVLKACSLEFKKEIAPISLYDYQFEELFGDPFDFFRQLGPEGEEVMDAYGVDFSAKGHKIGGYADFAQVDPRKPEWGYNIQLLQIDCEPSKDIDFGSAGVGHLFIKEEDLKNLDFSNVMYYWDCG